MFTSRSQKTSNLEVHCSKQLINFVIIISNNDISYFFFFLQKIEEKFRNANVSNFEPSKRTNFEFDVKNAALAIINEN